MAVFVAGDAAAHDVTHVEALGAVRGEFRAIDFLLARQFAEPVEQFVAFVEVRPRRSFRGHFEGKDAFEDISPELRVGSDLVVFRLIGEIEVGFLFFVAVAFAAEAVDHAAEAFLVRLAVGGVGRLRRRGGEDCTESGNFKKQ